MQPSDDPRRDYVPANRKERRKLAKSFKAFKPKGRDAWRELTAEAACAPLGDPALDLGVNPRLVFNVRQALDAASESWHLPASWRERARVRAEPAED